jgi:hypothetical protein
MSPAELQLQSPPLPPLPISGMTQTTRTTTHQGTALHLDPQRPMNIRDFVSRKMNSDALLHLPSQVAMNRSIAQLFAAITEA